MVREFGGAGILVKKEDWVAEQDCGRDGAKYEEKPMARGGGAIAIEGPSNRVLWGESRRFSRTFSVSVSTSRYGAVELRRCRESV